jgi:type II secretory pathway pseudopilin PulG
VGSTPAARTSSSCLNGRAGTDVKLVDNLAGPRVLPIQLFSALNVILQFPLNNANGWYVLCCNCLDTGRILWWQRQFVVMVGFRQTKKKKVTAAFTLVEVVLSIAILALGMAGMIYGYVQTNYQAEWSSMSLGAQTLAALSVEQARAAKWDVHAASTATGPGTSDELPAPTNYIQVFTNSLLIPSSGQALTVTNHVWVTTAFTNPPVRQIRADCWWQFPATGRWYSNTVITYRISDK